LPDIPTVSEFVPGYEASGWFGIGAPKDTPPQINSGRFWILLLAGKGAQVRGVSPVKLPRRRFLHLAAGGAALPAIGGCARPVVDDE
jgi:Tripartite tricarboxylate transporter family receptor